MQPQRITSLLQGVADVRNWIVRHIPLTESMVGYDLFLKLGNDFFAGQELQLKSIYAELPYTEKTIRAQIDKMKEAGLVVQQATGMDGRTHKLVPTTKFIALLQQYHRKFESLFILRKGLRDQQLLVDTTNPKLKQLAETLYDHFYDLGWLYLYNYGGICFLAASLVQRVARAYGHDARVESGYVDIQREGVQFLLGGKGYAAPGQIEGHAMCVIDDSLVLDFGLGNVRKGFRRDFPWALGCAYQSTENALGSMVLPTGETVTWKNDWQTPDGEAELQKYAPFVEQLFQHYVAHFG
ncbi:hypothetical protein E4K72_09485 [Oxalobacteraceae bacterium OM1]|nr:hypothetical protein E4K72_09485 [Oxalobacteraceae bacterium OM1]